VQLVHLVGFITKKFVTMHGHMNVKFATPVYSSKNDRIITNIVTSLDSKDNKKLGDKMKQLVCSEEQDGASS